MLTRYIDAAMSRAKYEMLEGEGGVYGHIPPCRGVWANASSVEQCRNELIEVLEDWLLFRIHKHLPIPKIGGVELKVRKESAA